MSFLEARARMQAAVFVRLGEDATWGAATFDPANVVRVRRAQPDEVENVGSSRIVTATVLIRVRRSEVPSPAHNDLVACADASFKLQGEPTIDAGGLVWTCQAKAVSP